MAGVRESMRDYINIIADPIESEQGQPAQDTEINNAFVEPHVIEPHNDETGIQDPHLTAPLTSMSNDTSFVSRIGDLARAIQTAFDSQDTPDSYFPDDMHDEIEQPEAGVYPDNSEQAEMGSDREMLADEEELTENPALVGLAARAAGGMAASMMSDDEPMEESTEEMAPAVDSQGHRSYADSEGSSFAARKGMTG